MVMSVRVRLPAPIENLRMRNMNWGKTLVGVVGCLVVGLAVYVTESAFPLLGLILVACVVEVS